MMKPVSLKRKIKFLIVLIMIFCVGILLSGVAFFVFFSKNIPAPKLLETTILQPSPSSIQKTEISRRILYRKKRGCLPKSYPKPFETGFCRGEDARFFQHRGLDYLAIFRAFLRNVFSREIVQGEAPSPSRSSNHCFFLLKEFFAESSWGHFSLSDRKVSSKEEILYLYLNQIYLGHGAYGVAVAAENYFGKPLRSSIWLNPPFLPAHAGPEQDFSLSASWASQEATGLYS